jgi:glucan endo-1,6-beta-glucosidase
MDATQTPGYGDCEYDFMTRTLFSSCRILSVQVNFVKTIRAVELLLGIPVPGETLSFKLSTTNFTSALTDAASSSDSGIFTDEIKSVLRDAAPILAQVGFELAIPAIFDFQLSSAPVHSQRAPLVAKYVLQDSHWIDIILNDIGAQLHGYQLATQQPCQSGRRCHWSSGL